MIIRIFAIFFAFLPAFFWFFLWYSKDSKEPEPKEMIFRAFFMGALAILPFLGIRYAFDNSSDIQEIWHIFSEYSFSISVFFALLFFAFFEEVIKHYAALSLGSQLKIEFNQIIDGIIYSVSAAMGFAFAENILYFFIVFQYYDFSNAVLWNTVAFRSLGTTLGHSLFSGIFGLFWGHAFLSQNVTPNHTISVKHFFRKFFDTLRFHIIRSHILIGRKSIHGHEKSELVREALFLATLIHFIFNLLLEQKIFGASLSFLIVPLLVGSFVFLSGQFLKKGNLKILEPV